MYATFVSGGFCLALEDNCIACHCGRVVPWPRCIGASLRSQSDKVYSHGGLFS